MNQAVKPRRDPWIDPLHAEPGLFPVGFSVHSPIGLAKECGTLLGNAEGVVEVSVIEDLGWHLAVDELDWVPSSRLKNGLPRSILMVHISYYDICTIISS